jgi:hypothetical protein
MDQPIRFQNRPQLEESWGYNRDIINYIHSAAAHGLYEIRGLGAKRKLPHFDDLLFLAASLSRYPLEGLSRAMRHQDGAWDALSRKNQSSWPFRSPLPE